MHHRYFYTIISFFLLLFSCFIVTSCGPYTFKDVSIPPEIKTIKVNFIENRASYKNPQLSPKLTDQLQQKVASYTRRTLVSTDNADYTISGYISTYSVSTSGISSQSGTRQVSTNRLTVGVHMTLFNRLDNKSQDYDVSRDFDFAASLTLPQAEAQLLDDIIKNLTDDIFNRLFSNW